MKRCAERAAGAPANGRAIFFATGRIALHAKLASVLDPRVKGSEWQDGFKFSDFVRSRLYDAREVKTFSLPGVLRHFDLDEL